MKKFIKVVAVLTGVLIVAFFCLRSYRLRSIPAAALACLRAPKDMTLYSIEPHVAPPDTPPTKLFHGDLILSEMAVPDRVDQKIAASALERAVGFWVGSKVACFNPRHGIRVADGSATYDFQICFECMEVKIYSGNEQIGSAGITGSPRALDELLRRSAGPLATP